VNVSAQAEGELQPARRGSDGPGIWGHFFQLGGIVVLRSLARFMYSAKIMRAGPLPPPPFVLACNHRSFLDPPLVGMCAREPVSYFARANLWRVPVVALMLRVMHSIPVEREHPGMSSMKGAVDRLRNGISVLVFPEGTRTRNGRLGVLRDGPALFARRAGVAVIPVYVHRTEQAWPRGRLLPRLGGCRVEIRFGRPLTPPAGLEARAQDRWVTERLRLWMQRLEQRLQARDQRRKARRC